MGSKKSLIVKIKELKILGHKEWKLGKMNTHGTYWGKEGQGQTISTVWIDRRMMIQMIGSYGEPWYIRKAWYKNIQLRKLYKTIKSKKVNFKSYSKNKVQVKLNKQNDET